MLLSYREHFYLSKRWRRWTEFTDMVVDFLFQGKLYLTRISLGLPSLYVCFIYLMKELVFFSLKIFLAKGVFSFLSFIILNRSNYTFPVFSFNSHSLVETLRNGRVLLWLYVTIQWSANTCKQMQKKKKSCKHVRSETRYAAIAFVLQRYVPNVKIMGKYLM